MSKRKQVSIRVLENQVSRIVWEVREHRTEYVVTRRGKPVAVLRPPDAKVDRTAEVEATMKRVRATAREVGKLTCGESTTSVVSRQRR